KTVRRSTVQPATRATVRRATGLSVTVSDGRGGRVRDAGLGRWLAAVAPAQGAVAIALVSDTRMRALNRRYRGKDRPTDVLAFANAEASPDLRALPELGDIVIATGVARRQAREQGHPYAQELRVLALHGLLHLLGYDHQTRKGRETMARAERRWRRKGRLEG